MKKRLTIQLVMAILLVMSGIVLLFSGFWIAPKGEIHNSVLVAFGETCTFAGALFGGLRSLSEIAAMAMRWPA